MRLSFEKNEFFSVRHDRAVFKWHDEFHVWNVPITLSNCYSIYRSAGIPTV